MTDVPHFSLPFRFATPQAAVTEQDSLDEIADCVTAILLCPVGYRVEEPRFGIDDPTFQQQPLDTDAIREAVETWEERAAVTFSQNPDMLDELIADVEALLTFRTAN
jgi:phage baseplate assembly protein W